MLDFLSQTLSNFKHTGAVWPSGSHLAREMTAPLRHSDRTRRILEVGPGTGPFTAKILNHLRPGDEFHMVEINPFFCKVIEKRHLAPFRERHPDIPVALHESPIEDAPIEGPFDHIICGLPFNNFPPSLVRGIFKRMLSLLAEDGDLTYFEYAAVRMMKAPVTSPTSRRNLRRIDAHAKSLHRRHRGSRRLVMANFPPAIAVRLRHENP